MSSRRAPPLPEYRISPLTSRELPDLGVYYADYARRSRTDTERSVAEALPGEERAAYLQWRAVRNPWRRDDTPIGHLIRDESGRIVGGHMIYALRLRLRGRCLLAGCSGDFYVDEAARTQGFFVFRRFLGERQFDVHLGTTCNDLSGRLWETSRASPIPSSDHEHVAALVLAPLVEEGALRRGLPARPLRWTATVERWLRTLSSLRRAGVSIEESDDWEELASIASAASEDELVTDRSVPYLTWSYADRFARDILRRRAYVWRDRDGHQGWFSVGFGRRGSRRQIRSAHLVDFVDPSGGAALPSVLPAILDAVRADADLFSIAGRADLSQWLSGGECRRRTFPRPIAWLIAKDHDQLDLASRAVIVDADRV